MDIPSAYPRYAKSEYLTCGCVEQHDGEGQWIGVDRDHGKFLG